MESKKAINIEQGKSSISLENRKKLMISGVIEVISFNDQQIMLDTNLGQLNIKGENLKMNKLDVKNGDLIIMGIVNSCIYSGKESKRDRQNLFAKLFK